MKVLVGTASWSDKSLVASKKFYPKGVNNPESRLRFYATQFHSRIGYSGVLKRHLDWGLLHRLTELRPSWAFVFVGPVTEDSETQTAVRSLARRRNVHFLGCKPTDQLPPYPQHFDACIMPYRTNDYTRYIYPLKLHEYLAPSGDTMWMQRLDAATGAAGSTARLNDTAPTTDQWNYAAVEIMSGAPPASVAVPSVVGQLRADAEAAIVGASLTVGAVTEANHPTMGIGRVISQTPGFPNSALVGSSVSLVVSLGPAPVTPPPAGGLVLALNFNELSGATALDASGNNLN